MAGIYIHIPFCRKACTYCNFHFSTNLGNVTNLIHAIILEIQYRKEELVEEKIESIYFGGGTPSVIDSNYIKEILTAINENYSMFQPVEITFECNPEDINIENLNKWKELGVNRLSIGVQCLQNTLLQKMNRMHTAETAMKSVNLALENGFTNLSVDLIFGIPNLSFEDWKKNVYWAFSCGANHISTYGLTVEPNTILHHQIEKGVQKNIDENSQIEQYTYLYHQAKNENWDFYEISNLCKNNNFSRHNSNYWKRKSYIGVGPSAHSYSKEKRRWNIANNFNYIEALTTNKTYFETEDLTQTNIFNEIILTSLRTKIGIDCNYVQTNFKEEYLVMEKKIIKFIENGFVEKLQNNYSLTLAGRLMADYITTELMI